MRNKSYIKLEVPQANALVTSALLAEISQIHPGFEIKTIESENNIYECKEVFVHNNDSVIDLSSNEDAHGPAIFAEVSSITARYRDRK